MDYNQMELLVIEAKNNNEIAKEKIIENFKPFIFNFCKKIHIKGYDKDDLHSECFKILMKAIKLYNPKQHRFVAYGTNAIKNSIHSILRCHLNKEGNKYTDIYSFTTDLEKYYKDNNYIDPISNIDTKLQIQKAMNKLNANDRKLIEHLYFMDMPLRQYCKKYNLNYSASLKKKREILKKLYCILN